MRAVRDYSYAVLAQLSNSPVTKKSTFLDLANVSLGVVEAYVPTKTVLQLDFLAKHGKQHCWHLL